jgi:hypothetical protein
MANLAGSVSTSAIGRLPDGLALYSDLFTITDNGSDPVHRPLFACGIRIGLK